MKSFLNSTNVNSGSSDNATANNNNNKYYHNVYQNKYLKYCLLIILLYTQIVSSSKISSKKQQFCNQHCQCCYNSKVMPIISPILSVSMQDCQLHPQNNFSFNFTFCNKDSSLYNTSINSIFSLNLTFSLTNTFGWNCSFENHSLKAYLSCSSSSSISLSNQCTSLQVELSFVNYSANDIIDYQSQLFATINNSSVSSNTVISSTNCSSLCETCNQYVTNLTNYNNTSFGLITNTINIATIDGLGSLNVISMMYNTLINTNGYIINSSVTITPVIDPVFLNNSLSQYSQCKCTRFITITSHSVITIVPGVTCISTNQNSIISNITFNFDAASSSSSSNRLFIMKTNSILILALREMNLINGALPCNIYWISETKYDDTECTIHFIDDLFPFLSTINIYGIFIVDKTFCIDVQSSANIIGKVISKRFVSRRTNLTINSDCNCKDRNVIPPIAPVLFVEMEGCELQPNNSFLFNFTSCNKDSFTLYNMSVINVFDLNISSVVFVSPGWNCMIGNGNNANILNCTFDVLSLSAEQCISVFCKLSFVDYTADRIINYLSQFVAVAIKDSDMAVSSNLVSANTSCNACDSCNQYVTDLIHLSTSTFFSIVSNQIRLEALIGYPTNTLNSYAIMYDAIIIGVGSIVQVPIQITPVNDVEYFAKSLSQYSNCNCDHVLYLNSSSSYLIPVIINVESGVTCIRSLSSLLELNNVTFNFNAASNTNSLFILKIDVGQVYLGMNEVQLINGAQPCNIYWISNSSMTIVNPYRDTIRQLYGIFIVESLLIQGRYFNIKGSIISQLLYLHTNIVEIDSSNCRCDAGHFSNGNRIAKFSLSLPCSDLLVATKGFTYFNSIVLSFLITVCLSGLAFVIAIKHIIWFNSNELLKNK